MSSSGAAPARLAFAGGGTGGHVVPGLHVLAAAGAGGVEDLLWFTSGRVVEERAFAGLDPRQACERVVLRLEPEGGGAPSLAALLARTPPAVLRARAKLKRHGSRALLALGGFTALPAALAARSLGLPVALLEINAAPGRATRWLAPLAARVLHAWSASLPAHAGARHARIGPPLDPRLFAPGPESGPAREALGFDPQRPLLVVVGGSQGAGALNAFVRAHGAALVAGGLQVLHQTGPGRLAEGLAPRAGYRAVEYVAPMEGALRAATLVLCRGGASTLAELAAVGAPGFVVPYPHHRDRHQERNARELGEGVRVVAEAGLGGELARELARLAGAEGAQERARMRSALRAAVPPGGAERALAELLALCGPSQ